jgi:hypothetical protein
MIDNLVVPRPKNQDAILDRNRKEHDDDETRAIFVDELSANVPPSPSPMKG